MKEPGIYISRKKPKHLKAVADQHFDLVVTFCDNARRECPSFPGAGKSIHHGFNDLPHPPRNMQREEALIHYRRVRDEIKSFVSLLPELISKLK